MSNLLKSKFFLGAMIVAVLGVAVAASATIASAADCTVVPTVKEGSKGASVSCVQTVVGATADGSFGPMTKAKVQAWQTANGLTADGVVGPATATAMNGVGTFAGNFPAGCSSASGFSTVNGASCAGGTSYPAGCSSASGFSSTTGMSCAGGTSYPAGCSSASGFSTTTGASCAGGMSYPAGCSSSSGFSSTTGLSCSGVVVNSNSNGEGSVTVTYDATPADNLVVNKSETKAVMGLKIKATGSDMKVSRLWLDLNARIWLSASVATLKDGSTVLATVPLSKDTVQETTIGSAWQLQFNGFNVNVPVGTTKILTLEITRPTLTNASASVAVAATSSVRATDAAGFSNTYTIGARIINLSGSTTASSGTLTATLSGSSPLAQSVSGLSTTSGNLTAVKLMDVDLKATDGPINVSAIGGALTATGVCTVVQCVASTELRDQSGNVLSSVTGAGTFSFTTLNIDVTPGSPVKLSVYGKMNHVAGSYVVAGDGINAAVTAVTATTNDFASTICASGCTTTYAPTVTGNIQYLFRYAPTITLGTTTATPSNSSGSISADYSIAFTVTAPAGQDIYVAQAVAAAASDNIAAAKTVSGNGGTVSDSTPMTASSTNGTDGSWGFIVLAGQSRTFTVYAHVPVGGVAGYTGVKITNISWNTVDSATADIDQIWGLADYKSGSVYVTAT